MCCGKKWRVNEHKKHAKKRVERSATFRSVCISRNYQLDFTNVRGIENCVPQCSCGRKSNLCFSC